MLVSTIGYEGSELQDFVAVLKSAKVDTLIDVRDLPLSRKRGFSKNSLRMALEEAGIQYLHLKSLGDPKEGREAARSGNYGLFRRIFLSHISNSEAVSDIEELVARAEDRHICLMCFERDYRCCHRNILIEKMSELCNLEVRHLGVPKGFYCRAA